MQTNRGEACLILTVSMIAKCESMACRFLTLKGVQLEVSEKPPRDNWLVTAKRA